MSDGYDELQGLLELRAQKQREIEEAWTKLSREHSEIEERINTKIREIAAGLGGGDAPLAGDYPPGTAAVEPEPAQSEEELVRLALTHYMGLPPRRRKLLWLLWENPGASFIELVRGMYDGRDDRAARGGLSAEFSGLKADGFVFSQEKGRFQLTELGTRAMANLNGAGGHH
jgi:hypothetical protein